MRKKGEGEELFRRRRLRPMHLGRREEWKRSGDGMLAETAGTDSYRFASSSTKDL